MDRNHLEQCIYILFHKPLLFVWNFILSGHFMEDVYSIKGIIHWQVSYWTMRVREIPNLGYINRLNNNNNESSESQQYQQQQNNQN